MTTTKPTVVNPVPMIRCRDECGNSIPVADVESAGWTYLEIQRRYRCPQCWRDLNSSQENPLRPSLDT